MSHVPSDKFDKEKLSLETTKDNSIKRTRLKYTYKDGTKKDLVLTTKEECFIRCLGAKADHYNNIPTGKHSCTFLLDAKEKADLDFFEKLQEIKEFVEKESGREVKLPVSISVQEDANEICYLYVKLIESNDGRMFSKIRNDEETENKETNPSTIIPCISRPGIIFSYSESKNIPHINLKLSLSMLVIKKAEFSKKNILDKSLSE
jgi:hypothetical protein